MRDLTAVVIYRHARFFKVMSSFISPARPKIVYPDSDGQPMSDNTLQFKRRTPDSLRNKPSAQRRKPSAPTAWPPGCEN